MEFARIEKPDTKIYDGKRKLYCLPNVYPIPESSDRYRSLCSRYWQEAEIQISKLELMTPITKVFCEMVFKDENALEILSKIDEFMHNMVEKYANRGAKIVPIEEEEIFSTYIDWANCLKVVHSKTVFAKVLEFYNDIANKRFSFITDVINKNLGSCEAGLLILKDEDRRKITFPEDVEIFLVTPPAYDDILKFIRDLMIGKVEK